MNWHALIDPPRAGRPSPDRPAADSLRSDSAGSPGNATFAWRRHDDIGKTCGPEDTLMCCSRQACSPLDPGPPRLARRLRGLGNADDDEDADN